MKTVTSKTKKVALISLMVALTTVFSFVPFTIGPVTLAIMILPTLIIAQVEDFKTTTAVALFMGLINLVAWYSTKAASPVAPIFQNPIICVIPRLMVGIVAWLITNAVKKYFVKDTMTKPVQITVEQTGVVISTALGVVSNTAFVSLFTLLFFNNKTLPSGTAINVEYLLAWFGLNFIVEVVSFALITPPIVLALKKAKLVAVKQINKQEIIDNMNSSEDSSAISN